MSEYVKERKAEIGKRQFRDFASEKRLMMRVGRERRAKAQAKQMARVEPLTFNTAEAAKYTGVAKSTLEKYRSGFPHGVGPVFVKLGKTVRYLKADLDAWLDAHKVT